MVWKRASSLKMSVKGLEVWLWSGRCLSIYFFTFGFGMTGDLGELVRDEILVSGACLCIAWAVERDMYALPKKMKITIWTMMEIKSARSLILVLALAPFFRILQPFPGLLTIPWSSVFGQPIKIDITFNPLRQPGRVLQLVYCKP